MSTENQNGNTTDNNLLNNNIADDYSFYLEDAEAKEPEILEAETAPEEKAPEAAPRRRRTAPSSATPESDALTFEYFVLSVGSYVGNAFLAIVRAIALFFAFAFDKVKQFFIFAYRKLDEFVISSVKAFADEWAFFRKEVKSSIGALKKAASESPAAVIKTFKHYVDVALERHPHMFGSIVNVALPVVGFAILMGTITHWSSSTFALEVESGGQKIGYVTNENVYIEAQSLVKERFDSDLKGSNTDLSANYSVVTVQPNEISDSTTISDSIVENTKNDSTYACGVYIDGDFVCALKSETEAMQVFNNIIDNYPVDDENAVVGFVEDIQYVQGLYPDNSDTIWDSEKLANKLSGTKSAAKYYDVQAGDTISQIANANGMSSSELFALNPQFGETIRVGDTLLVSNEVNYVQLKVVKTEVVKEEIPFKTVKTNNDKLYKGTTKVKKRGVKGLDEVTNLVTYVDGVKVSSEEINRTTLRNVVDEQVDVGTKKATYVGGGYTSSTYVKGQGSLIWPAVGCYRVSSPYGYRTIYGRRSFHGGVDLISGNSRGKTVVAAASGTVVTAGWGGSYGYYVIINHGNGMSTLYAHMLQGSLCVSAGQYVSGGSAIGKVGSTGNSTGNHLHFEVRINGNKVNPAPYLGI